MVPGETDCPHVLPGELGRRQTHYCVSGHAGWGVVQAERLTAYFPVEGKNRSREPPACLLLPTKWENDDAVNASAAVSPTKRLARVLVD
jgi:hypothetical protein